MKIIQLSESIEYPQGFNSITIEGYNDSAGFQLREWPRITLTIPNNIITSQGVQCIAEIYDPDPSAYFPAEQAEHIGAENPTTINTSKYIQAITGIWYYLGEVGGEPIKGDAIEWLSFEGNVITTRYELLYQDVWVEYTGNDTISFSQSGVSGEMNPEEVMVDGTTAISYFCPDADADAGTATITARYKNVEASAIYIFSGHGDNNLDNRSIQVDADPSSIAVGETSTITINLTDKNGSPIVNAEMTVAVIRGRGYCSPDTVTTTVEAHKVENVISNDASTVSVSEAISTVNSVSFPGYSYTGCSFEGHTILLNNPLPYAETPVTVNYDTGGVATTTFYGTAEGTSYIAAFYRGFNGVTDIEVTAAEEGAGFQRNITLEADPASIPISGCSCLRITVTDDEDNPLSGEVEVYILTGNGSIASAVVSLGTKYREEQQQASSLTEVSVDYSISSLIDIIYNGVSYLAGATFQGESITLATPLPGNVPLTVRYYAGGYAENVFYAPEGVGMTVINARFTDITGTYIDTATIDITAPSSGTTDENGNTREVQPIYDTRVIARAIGFLNPYDHIEEIYCYGCSAAFDSWGAGDVCDAWGGVDADPSGAPIIIALTPAAFGLAVVEYTVSGGQLMGRPNTFYTTLQIAVDWSYTLNARFMRLRVTERPTEPDADGIPIGDASWVLGGETRTTDAEGVTTFSRLPAGTYPTSITHANYKTNTEDTDEDNDTVVVEETTNRRYKLSVTNIDISVTARFISGWTIINPPGEEEEPTTPGETPPCCAE